MRYWPKIGQYDRIKKYLHASWIKIGAENISPESWIFRYPLYLNYLVLNGQGLGINSQIFDPTCTFM